jgi:hypothetical protein
MSAIWLGDSTFAADGVYFGLVTAAGGDTTGFQYNSVGTPETYHTHFGTTNSSTAYWIRAYIDIDLALGKMKGWSGAIVDEPGPWSVERTFTGACPNPIYLCLHCGTTSNAASAINIWQLIITNPYSVVGSLDGLDHGTIGGLADDDHTQYLKANGTRALSANWDAGSFKITAETLASDVATGTAPLTVASTTVVANLNASTVGGKAETVFSLIDGTRAYTGNQAWSNAAGPQIQNEAASATNPTLLPNKADDNTGIGWNSADHLSFITGGVEACSFKNGSTFIVKTMDIQMDNAKELRGIESGGVNNRNLIGVDASNDIQVGDTSNTLILNASDYITADFGGSLQVGDVATDELTLIDGTTGVLSQHDSAYIDTENYVSADMDVRSRMYESSAWKTLTDNTAANFFKWSPTTKGDHAHWIISYSIYVEYVISAVTYYYCKAGLLSAFAYFNGTNICFGALTEVSAPAVLNTGVGVFATSFALPVDGVPDRGPSVTVDLSGLGTSWTAGTVQYAVVSTDADHRAYSVFGPF